MKYSKIISTLLSIFVFIGNCMLLDAKETNFWKDREKSIQLAGLITAPPEISGFRIPSRSPFSQHGSSNFEKTLASNIRNLELLKPLNSSYGAVRKITKSKDKMSGPVVLHIQDVHLNREAQINISKSIKALIAKEKVDLIALEGAFGPINFAPFKTYPHQDSLQKVSDFLFKENKMSGPVLAGFQSEKQLPLFVGIDDKKHYEANVRAYQESSLVADKIKIEISALQKETDALKTKIMNKDLLKFDRKSMSYHRGKLELGDYLKGLVRASGAKSASLNVETFLSAYQLQSSIKFTRMETECSQLLKRLVGKLKKGQPEELMRVSVAYRAGEISNIDFYNYLEDLCNKTGIPLKKFPEVNSYIQYILLTESIDAEKLFADAKLLEEGVYASLIKSDEERKLVELSKFIYLADKLVNFGMTTDEWLQYKSIQSSFPSVSIGNPMSYKSKVAGSPITNFGDDGLRSFERFYEEAEIRDGRMAENLKKAIERTGAKNIVLITGGFHSRGIEHLLVPLKGSPEDFTVVSFTPKITKVGNENGLAYLTVFTQEKSTLEKFFEGERLFLAPPSMTLSFRETAAIMALALDIKKNPPESANKLLRKMVPDGSVAIKKVSTESGTVKFLASNGFAGNRLIRVSVKNNTPQSLPLLEALDPRITLGIAPVLEELARMAAFNLDMPFLATFVVYSVLHAVAHIAQDFSETKGMLDLTGRIAGRTLISSGFGLVFLWTGFFGAWFAHFAWNYLVPKDSPWMMSVFNQTSKNEKKSSKLKKSYASRLGISTSATPDEIEAGYRNTIGKYLNSVWRLGEEFDPDRKELNQLIEAYSTIRGQLEKSGLYNVSLHEKLGNPQLDLPLTETLVTLRRIREDEGKLEYLTAIEILKGLVLEKGNISLVKTRMMISNPSLISKTLQSLNIPENAESAQFRHDLAREVTRLLAPSFNPKGGEAKIPTGPKIRNVILESLVLYPNNVPAAAKWTGLSVESFTRHAKELDVSLIAGEIDEEYLRYRLMEALQRYPVDVKKAADWALLSPQKFKQWADKFKIPLDIQRTNAATVFDDPDILFPSSIPYLLFLTIKNKIPSVAEKLTWGLGGALAEGIGILAVGHFLQKNGTPLEMIAGGTFLVIYMGIHVLFENGLRRISGNRGRLGLSTLMHGMVFGGYFFYFLSNASLFWAPAVILFHLLTDVERLNFKLIRKHFAGTPAEVKLASAILKDVVKVKEGKTIKSPSATVLQMEKIIRGWEDDIFTDANPVFSKLMKGIEDKELDGDILGPAFDVLAKKQFKTVPEKISIWIQTTFLSELNSVPLKDEIEIRSAYGRGAVVLVDDELAENSDEIKKIMSKFGPRTQLESKPQVLFIPTTQQAEEKLKTIIGRGYHHHSLTLVETGNIFEKSGPTVTLKLKYLEPIIENTHALRWADAFCVMIPQGLTVDTADLPEKSRLRYSVFLFISSAISSRALDFSRLNDLFNLTRLILKQS